MSSPILETAPIAAATTPVSGDVRYAPGNCALLVGPRDLLLGRLEALRVAGLRPCLLCTDLPDMASLPRSLHALSGRLAELSGWMGAFSASMQTLRQPMSLAPLSFHEDGHFDWVLDFSPAPSIRQAVPPLGYYALPPDDFPALKRTLLEIVGRIRSGYSKPRYFRLDPDACAHGRQSVPGCEACLSACAAGAIRSDKESVRVEPYLCQGCGGCALVCPTGAIRYDHPAPGTSLNSLHAMLAAPIGGAQDASGLWITRESPGCTAPEGWLTYPVAEPASVGLEFWLNALVMGLDEVAIDTTDLPESTCVALDEQVALARALLAGLGLRQTVRLDTDPEPRPAGTARSPSPYPTAQAPSGDDKRAQLFAVIDALAARADSPPDSLPLPAGPLGEIRVDAGRCTLCTACVGTCPAGALSVSSEATELLFTEANCVQCGICARACPEQAIALAPRLLISRTARGTPRVIVEVERFACRGCGSPFASRAQIEKSRALMREHPMFQGDNARLMDLCPACRQKATVGVPV